MSVRTPAGRRRLLGRLQPPDWGWPTRMVSTAGGMPFGQRGRHRRHGPGCGGWPLSRTDRHDPEPSTGPSAAGRRSSGRAATCPGQADYMTGWRWRDGLTYSCRCRSSWRSRDGAEQARKRLRRSAERLLTCGPGIRLASSAPSGADYADWCDNRWPVRRPAAATTGALDSGPGVWLPELQPCGPSRHPELRTSG